MSRQLTELLLKDRIITPAQFNEVTGSGREDLIKLLIEKKHIADNKLLFYLSQRFGMPSVNLAKFEISPEIMKLIPSDQARKLQVIPLQSKKGTLVVAIWDPTNLQRLEDLKFIVKMNIEPVLTSFGVFEEVFSKHFTAGAAGFASAVESYKKDVSQLEGEGSVDVHAVEVHNLDAGSSEVDAPVISLVNGILGECVKRGASDIHVEPYEHRFRIRMRIDGVLHEITEVPQEMKRAVTARFKIMSRMDIAESRIPQDGRIKLKAFGKDVDFRVNTLPTLYGEKVVLRLLSKGNLQLDLTKLGFEPRQIEIFKKGIYAPNGMVLVTGPTGSGKTTTLYSAIAELNQKTDNIATAEDPVEYNFEGVNQTEIHKEIGLTFANVLRAMLRQDPDIILVGEIRDYETAEVAIQAALTGHLVLSTLHTNEAPATITRLINMGIEPFLVVAALHTIVAQRLIRKICAKCKVEFPVPKEKLIQLGFSPDAAAQTKMYTGKGCAACNNSGYKGRLAIYEVMEITNEIKELILKGESAMIFKKMAISQGMKTLRLSALTKAMEGQTSLEEALSSTMET